MSVRCECVSPGQDSLSHSGQGYIGGNVNSGKEDMGYIQTEVHTHTRNRVEILGSYMLKLNAHYIWGNGTGANYWAMGWG